MEESSYIMDLPKAHEGEHSVEVQVPFLQRIAKDFSIVPMVTNARSSETCQEVGEAIARVIKDEKALIVISTDFSHFPGVKTADLVDRTVVRSLEFMDPRLFYLTCQRLVAKRLPGLSTAACGQAAVRIGMYAANALGANRAVPIHYVNSGQLSGIGDPTRCVGYSACAFVAQEKPGAPLRPQIGDAEKKLLKKFAREAIENRLAGRRAKQLPVFENLDMNLPSTVFVTLKKEGRLRGCIGCTEPGMPLAEAMQNYALAAAFQDRRFRPVQKEELDAIKIELSILSPLQRVASADVIEPKVHGVVVRQGRNSGIFLPQVWDSIPKKGDFLGELCSQKARLPRTAWKDPATKLFVFTVEKF